MKSTEQVISFEFHEENNNISRQATKSAKFSWLRRISV